MSVKVVFFRLVNKLFTFLGKNIKNEIGLPITTCLKLMFSTYTVDIYGHHTNLYAIKLLQNK